MDADKVQIHGLAMVNARVKTYIINVICESEAVQVDMTELRGRGFYITFDES